MVADTPRPWPLFEDLTADPVYARLISGDTPPPRASRDVYCYFDNTDKLHAPDNARELMALLGVAWNPPG